MSNSGIRRIKVLTQVYWPDDVSTAQHLVDLCEELAREGCAVEVVASYRKYEDRRVKFPLSEVRNDVRIRRLRDTGFGKSTWVGRVLDYTSFNVLLFFHLLFGPKPDMYLGMTSPPLVSFVGAFIARVKKCRFCYWTMDLQPELSIRSGLIRKGSMSARLLTRMGDYVFRHSDAIVVLDKYMRDHAINRGADPEAISIVPVWPVMNRTFNGSRTDNPFRTEHGFGNARVIMYSGNHSYVHPLDTILDAALLLKDEKDLLFAFIGGGVRAKEVTEFKEKHGLDNIVKLPFQPRDLIHISLGAADYQLVIMGDGLIGYTHPNKVYGAMFIGKPILYIGPFPSHVSDIIDGIDGNITVQHGQSRQLAESLQRMLKQSQEEIDCVGAKNLEYANDHFHPEKLKSEMVQAVINGFNHE